MMGTTGQIMLFPGLFVPRGWKLCDGTPLKIRDYWPLFEILGTQFGGDGDIHFNLPDFRGRSLVGRRMGVDRYEVGAKGGAEHVTLTREMIAHEHSVSLTINLPYDGLSSQKNTPTGNIYGVDSAGAAIYSLHAADAFGPMEAKISTADVGGSKPIDIRCPYLGLNYIICVDGHLPNL